MTATALALLFNPSLGVSSSSAQEYVSLLIGVSIMIYQTLDNMDGKQARRTGTSSAHGMLFDHGCDAVQAGVSAFSMANVLGVGWAGVYLLSWCTFLPFYFMSWEQLHTGRMYLPVINGPSEGLLVASSMGLLSYFKGTAWWHTETLVNLMPFADATVSFGGKTAVAVACKTFRQARDFGYSIMLMLPSGMSAPLPSLEASGTESHTLVLSPLSAFIVFMVVCVTGTVLSHIFNVYRTRKNVKEGVLATIDLLPILLLVTVTALWVPYDLTLASAVTALAEDPASASIFERVYPILVFGSFANFFLESVTGIMLSELTKSRRLLPGVLHPMSGGIICGAMLYYLKTSRGKTTVVTMMSTFLSALSVTMPSSTNGGDVNTFMTNSTGTLQPSAEDLITRSDGGLHPDTGGAGGTEAGVPLSYFEKPVNEDDTSACCNAYCMALVTATFVASMHFCLAFLYRKGYTMTRIARFPKIILVLPLPGLAPLIADIHTFFGVAVTVAALGQQIAVPLLAYILEVTSAEAFMTANFAPVAADVVAWVKLFVPAQGSTYLCASAIRALGLADVLIPSFGMASVLYVYGKALAQSRELADILGLTWILRSNRKVDTVDSAPKKAAAVDDDDIPVQETLRRRSVRLSKKKKHLLK